MPVFETLQRKHPEIKIHLIGAKRFESEGIDIKFFDWSEVTEIGLLSEFDIGIMPLTDDRWSKGKGGLKILQYFAMGIPIVCSPVGINNELVDDGWNGFLAKNTYEWIQKLELLIENKKLRKEMGKAGRNLVEQRFDLKKSVAYIEDITRKVIF
jgi:glycosyltransferase involved in cell wall biosynthesis